MKYIFLLVLPLFISSCGTTSSSLEDTTGFQHGFMDIIEDNSATITETTEFSKCLEPSVNMCITQVANNLAQQKKSLSVCEKLKKSEDVNSCKYGVVISTLNENNIAKLCDTLTGKYKEECLLTSVLLSAESSADLEICNQMNEISFSGNEEGLSNRIDQCKFTVIMKNENAKTSDCDLLSQISQKNTCTSMIKSRGVQKVPNNK